MKLDITVSKQMTINTGNYSSVRPSVTVTAKDVDSTKFEDAYQSLSCLVSNLFKFEAAGDIAMDTEIKRSGVGEFSQTVFKDQDVITSEINDTLIELKGLDDED